MVIEKRKTFTQKQEIIAAYQKGESISHLAKTYGISRTSLHKWIKAPAVKIESKAAPHHWNKYSSEQEQQIIRYSLKHPASSPQTIAKRLGLGRNGVWRVLKKHNLSPRQARQAYLTSPAYLIKQPSGSALRIAIMMRYAEGESVTHLCREYGISRTIFYKWLKRYNEAQNKEQAFESRRPQGVSHWHFSAPARRKVLDVVREYPQLSANKISQELKKDKISISHNAVHSILKEYQISRLEARMAFVGSAKQSWGYVGVRSSEKGLGSFGSTEQNSLVNRTGESIGSFSAGKSGVVISISLPVSREQIRESIIAVGSMVALCTLVLTFISTVRSYTPLPQQDVKGLSVNISQALTPIPTPVQKLTSLPQPKPSNANDFSHGVLAVNRDKSVYKVGEPVNLIFGVLDKNGVTVCDADILVSVVGVGGKTRTYKTDRTNMTNNIKMGESCDANSYSVLPDYWITLPTTEAGNQMISVSAKTKDGILRSNQQINVLSDEDYAKVPYVVRRTSMPTRIYPEGSYNAEVDVEFHEDFDGTVEEGMDEALQSQIPAGTWQSRVRGNEGLVDQVIGGENNKLVWNVSAKIGDVKQLFYSVDFPLKSPEFYELGGLTLTDHAGKELPQSNYTWQIALDAPVPQ